MEIRKSEFVAKTQFLWLRFTQPHHCCVNQRRYYKIQNGELFRSWNGGDELPCLPRVEHQYVDVFFQVIVQGKLQVMRFRARNLKEEFIV